MLVGCRDKRTRLARALSTYVSNGPYLRSYPIGNAASQVSLESEDNIATIRSLLSPRHTLTWGRCHAILQHLTEPLYGLQQIVEMLGAGVVDVKVEVHHQAAGPIGWKRPNSLPSWSLNCAHIPHGCSEGSAVNSTPRSRSSS